MADLLGGLMSQLGGDAVSQMANKIGASPEATQSALGSMLPIMISAMAKNASTPEGANNLSNALQKDHSPGLLDNVMGFLGDGGNESAGGGILGHVLGAKTQNVEKYVADDSGLSPSATSSLMKMAAPLVMSYLSKQTQASGGGADMLSGLLSSAVSSNKTAAPQSQNIIEQLLDANNDGSIMDDVAKMGMSFLGKMFK